MEIHGQACQDTGFSDAVFGVFANVSFAGRQIFSRVSLEALPTLSQRSLKWLRIECQGL
jgi:hypothetical protein